MSTIFNAKMDAFAQVHFSGHQFDTTVCPTRRMVVAVFFISCPFAWIGNYVLVFDRTSVKNREVDVPLNDMKLVNWSTG